MRTREVADRARVNPQTLRCHERRGWLADRSCPLLAAVGGDRAGVRR